MFITVTYFFRYSIMSGVWVVYDLTTAHDKCQTRFKEIKNSNNCNIA